MKTTLTVELQPTGKLNGKQDKEILKAEHVTSEGKYFVTFYRNLDVAAAKPAATAKPPVVRKQGKPEEKPAAVAAGAIDPEQLKQIVAALKAAGV